MLSRIDDLRTKLDTYHPLTQGELSHLRENFIIDFTYSSAAIEGNALTLEETALILRHDIAAAGKGVRDHMEIIGHRNAFLYIESLMREKVPMTERVIKKLHSLVLIEKPHYDGAFRSIPVKISDKQALFAKPHTVQVEMDWLLSDYETSAQNMHPIERAALFHLRFETIHPFAERNGMIGRLLLNMELMKNGYLPICIQPQDKSKYVDTTRYRQISGETQASQPMLTFIAGKVIETLEQRIELLEIANDPAHGQQGISV